MSRTARGWGFYEKNHINAENPKNVHIFEGTITYEDSGEIKFSANGNAVCSVRKKSPASYLHVTENKTGVRNKAAELENSGKTVCGKCVSHFYADPTP